MEHKVTINNLDLLSALIKAGMECYKKAYYDVINSC